MTNFLEGQKVLLDLGKQERVPEGRRKGADRRLARCPGDGRSAAAQCGHLYPHAQEFLNIAGRQTHTWVEAAKAGSPMDAEPLVGLASEGMENFVKAQNIFWTLSSRRRAKATSGRHINGVAKKAKYELTELAKQATESFIDAQKSWWTSPANMINTVKTASKSFEMGPRFPFLPLAELTREGVKSYVDAQKALMDVVGEARNTQTSGQAGTPCKKGEKRAREK